MKYCLDEALGLVLPNSCHESLWKNIINEYLDSGEEPYPYGLHLDFKTFEYHKYLRMDARNRKKNLFRLDFVPSHTYFLINAKKSEIIGTTNIRCKINKYYMEIGGHISYSVRPSLRGHGYGNKILALALEKCKEAGLQKALLTCYKDNTPSSSIIKNNGGKLENTICDSTGKLVERYWITVM